MILSKERLLKEKQISGYRQEIIEKVIWLMEILNAIANDSYLSTRLALKGGTALNLFHFGLPRLSVDADLNYIGAIDRSTMLSERPEVENRIRSLFERMKLKMLRNPKEHAGGKMVWRYPSALGNQGNIEVDINFMYRVPLLSTEKRDSITIAGKRITNLQILDIHELAAGKLTALLERQTGRDFFDANELFQYAKINQKKLRIIFVLYSAMCSKKDMLSLTIDDITVNHSDLKNKLIPVLKNNFCDGFSSTEEWTATIIKNVQKGFNALLPYTPSETEFIRSVINGTGVNPELFIDNENLLDFSLIKKHPALLWAKMRIKK
ncbi:MAG: nucleotidyl transferase AbiEii/AbiGii toxin family protein [Legionellales bacterium]|nr:nucleotidyl transferase AbiEii/AbiGii toxin family protein [Legionellales bacterium]